MLRKLFSNALQTLRKRLTNAFQTFHKLLANTSQTLCKCLANASQTLCKCFANSFDVIAVLGSRSRHLRYRLGPSQYNLSLGKLWACWQWTRLSTVYPYYMYMPWWFVLAAPIICCRMYLKHMTLYTWVWGIRMLRKWIFQLATQAS